MSKLGAGTLALTGANTYTGATTISAGTLQLGNGGTTGSLSPSSAITNNGLLAFNRSNAVAQGTDFSAAAITGTGGLNQLGAGTTTLTAANTYTGTTLITAGTLLISSTGSISGSTSVSVTGTGALTLQNAPALSSSTTLSLVGGTTLNLDATAGTTETVAALVLDGTPEPSGTYTASQLSGFDSGITFESANGETLTVEPVPEPATWAAGGLCFGLLGLSQRRKVQSWLGMTRVG